jgi:TRAP-type C4-dicarboxylate transport system permease small subunit
MADSPAGDRDGGRLVPDTKHTRALKSLFQNIELYLIYIFYVYLLFVVIVEVFRRYGLSMSSIWSSESARYAFLYITYIGISLAAYKRTHIRIGILLDAVSERVEGYLYLFSNFVLLAFAAYAIWYTIPLIQTSLEFGAETQALAINRAFAQFAIPVGLTMMVVRVLQRTYQDVRDIRAGRPVFKGENVFTDDTDIGDGEGA